MTECPGLAVFEEAGRLVARLGTRPENLSLDVDRLREFLAQAGYGQWRLSEVTLLSLVERYNTSDSESDLVLGEVGELGEPGFSLEIDKDAMQAWVSLSVNPALGGKALMPDDIYLKLGEAGVTFGIDQNAVLAACAASEAGRFLVAAGQPAEKGQDARFELLIADARDRSPQLDEHGMIDFRNLGAMPTAHAEQDLMRRIPPTTGTAGRTIRGEVLEPEPGRNENFADHLVGAYVAKDDANLLRAVFSGQPVRCGNGVHVEPVLRVRNVNMASGNVTFDGTVNVEGEVLPGMKVHATGDILVGDVVDGAELEAGGDIHVSGGIIAKARVQAGGSVSARFVESAHIVAGTTIAIDDSALQCDLQANNQIVVGLKSPQRGRLAGGSARAMMLIQAPILGSSTGGVTSLLLGVNPVLDAQYKALLQQIEHLKADEDNLEKLVKHLTKQGEKAAALLERAKASWQQAIKAWARLLPERDELERQLALVSGARVEVGVSVDGAIDLTLASKTHRVRKNYDAGVLSMEGGRLVFVDPLGNMTTAG